MYMCACMDILSRDRSVMAYSQYPCVEVAFNITRKKTLACMSTYFFMDNQPEY